MSFASFISRRRRAHSSISISPSRLRSRPRHETHEEIYQSHFEDSREDKARAIAHEVKIKLKRKLKKFALELSRLVKLKIKFFRRDFFDDDVSRAIANAFANEDARIEVAHINEDDINEKEKDSEKNETTRQERIVLKIALTSLKINKKSKQSKKKIIVALDDEFVTSQLIARVTIMHYALEANVMRM